MLRARNGGGFQEIGAVRSLLPLIIFRRRVRRGSRLGKVMAYVDPRGTYFMSSIGMGRKNYIIASHI